MTNQFILARNIAVEESPCISGSFENEELYLEDISLLPNVR